MRMPPSYRLRVAVLFVTVLFVGLAGMAAAQGQSQQHRPSGTPAQGPPEGMSERRPGHLEAADGAASGRYINFTYDEAAGSLADYSVGGIVFFSSIQAPGALEAKGQGARLRFAGDNVSLEATDNPVGLLRMQSGSGSFVLALADGVDAAQNGSRVELEAGGLSATVSNGSLSGSSLSVTSGLFMLHGPAVSVVAKTVKASQQAIHEAVAEGRVAARIQVLDNGTDVLSYENVSVSARQLPNGSHRVTFDGNLTGGRAFVLEFAPGMMMAKAYGVRYYDEELGVLVPVEIGKAESLADALDAAPGEGPEYFVVEGLEGAQVVVSAPGFSIHAFEVFAISPQAAPLLIYGLVVGVLVVFVLGAGAVLGRRK